MKPNHQVQNQSSATQKSKTNEHNSAQSEPWLWHRSVMPQNLAYIRVHATSSQYHTQHHRHGRKGQSYTTQCSSQLMHYINDRSCCVSPASKPKLADITQKVSTQRGNWVWQLHTVTRITAYVAHTHTHCSQKPTVVY